MEKVFSSPPPFLYMLRLTRKNSCPRLRLNKRQWRRAKSREAFCFEFLPPSARWSVLFKGKSISVNNLLCCAMLSESSDGGLIASAKRAKVAFYPAAMIVLPRTEENSIAPSSPRLTIIMLKQLANESTTTEKESFLASVEIPLIMMRTRRGESETWMAA